MKLADAPPPGWYPDPAGGSRLRWWEGTDWTDRYRAPPTPSEMEIQAARRARTPGTAAKPPKEATLQVPADRRGVSRKDTEEIIAEVRKVARSEVDRAADVFTQRAQAATREIQPLISEYTNKLMRWFRIAVVVIPLIVLTWFVFEAIAQVTFFDWVGDRIDNLTD